jgi:hypothetical protein
MPNSFRECSTTIIIAAKKRSEVNWSSFLDSVRMDSLVDGAAGPHDGGRADVAIATVIAGWTGARAARGRGWRRGIIGGPGGARQAGM